GSLDRRRRIVGLGDGAGEAALDHLPGQEMLALLTQDPAQAFHVGVVELPIAGRGALWIEQALALEESDLGDGDVGELVLEEREHFPNRHERPLRHRHLYSGAASAPEKNTSLNFPIWSSSPVVSGDSSMRCRFR